MICDNLCVNNSGHLTFAGFDTVELAKKYGTPLYLLDEQKIVDKCRIYVNAMKKYFGEGSYPLYAGKALCFKGLYPIINKGNMGIDVVSCGEIYTAYSAGFPMEKAYFHGNNKTDADVAYAIEHNVGYFVCDNIEELNAIEREASARNVKQKILIRVTPGIDPHTHAAITTGKVDSKFGAAIETGQAEELVKDALGMKHIRLMGYHCHIGSQIFDTKPFVDAAEIMLDFCISIRKTIGFTASELNLGGGMGVRYLEEHPQIDYAENISVIAEAMKTKCKTSDYPFPNIRMEPGRSIVADAGMTLYTVGTVKEIKGFRSYVSIDGGMPDNPRYALYQSPYTVELANRMNDKKDFVCTVAGRCCESGDLIQEGVKLPRPNRGDTVAVLTTGAYNYSMASNYNRIPRPPVVILSKDGDRVVVKRETFENITSLDV